MFLAAIVERYQKGKFNNGLITQSVSHRNDSRELTHFKKKKEPGKENSRKFRA